MGYVLSNPAALCQAAGVKKSVSGHKVCTHPGAATHIDLLILLHCADMNGDAKPPSFHVSLLAGAVAGLTVDMALYPLVRPFMLKKTVCC